MTSHEKLLKEKQHIGKLRVRVAAKSAYTWHYNPEEYLQRTEFLQAHKRLQLI